MAEQDGEHTDYRGEEGEQHRNFDRCVSLRGAPYQDCRFTHGIRLSPIEVSLRLSEFLTIGIAAMQGHRSQIQVRGICFVHRDAHTP
jgi:hypothetical protein